jgi:hypothetical protein
MKKTIIALSAVLLASPVFAATTHATDDTVAAANANANEAKQKLHEEQNKGEELKLKQKHAAEVKAKAWAARSAKIPRKPGIKPNKAPRKGGMPPKKALRKAGTKPKKVPASWKRKSLSNPFERPRKRPFLFSAALRSQGYTCHQVRLSRSG